MIIDAHNHAQWLEYDLEKTLQNMDEGGIDKTVMLSWICPRDEYDPTSDHLYNNPAEGGPLDFAHALAYRQAHPDRFLLGYAPDPRRPGAVKELAQMMEEHPIVLCGEVKLRMMIDNPDALELFRYCGQVGLPVVLHLDYPIPVSKGHGLRDNYWYCGTIKTLEQVLIACPDTIFLGHAPGFWGHISKDEQAKQVSYPSGPVIPGGEVERLLGAYKNLYCDMSAYSACNALKRDMSYSKALIMRHPERFLFARDSFSHDLHALLQEMNLPQDVLEGILHENIKTLCKL